MRATILLLAFTLACATPPKRSRAAEAEAQGLEVERIIAQAGAALDAKNLDEAESKAKDAKARLQDPVIASYPDHHVLASDLERIELGIAAARAGKAQAETEQRAQAQTAKVEQALAELAKSLGTLEGPALSRAAIDGVTPVIERAAAAVTEGQDLEAVNTRYAERAKGARHTLDEARATQASARKLLAFKEGPAAAYQAALGVLEKASAEQDAGKRLGMYADARNKLKDCKAQGTEQLQSAPAIASAKLTLTDKPTSPADILAACEDRLRVFENPGARPAAVTPAAAQTDEMPAGDEEDESPAKKKSKKAKKAKKKKPKKKAR